MKKEFVPKEEALELQKLGFDEPCLKPNKSIASYHITTIKKKVEKGALPLYQQAFRWFREEYKLHSIITSISQESWQFHITKPGQSLGELYEEDFYNYKEAEFACLKRLIKLIKENGNNNNRT